MRSTVCALILLSTFGSTLAEDRASPSRLIGYTEFRTDLPGGRHANVRTMQAMVVSDDGSGRRAVADDLAEEADAWTQFGSWSPDGKVAVIGRGWQRPDNASWEEQNGRFRMVAGAWLYDSHLLDLRTGALTNVTAVDRVSHYNGLTFRPDGRKLLMTSLVDGTSKPFLMDLDGRNKVDVSGGTEGFTYGLEASPDGSRIAYHEGYQIFVARADGSGKKRIETGNPFNFSPRWSPDSRRLLFVSGEHYDCHPYVVRDDGSGLRKLADRNGYRGVIEFLDVPDFHGGSSDTPVWSADGKSVFYTAKAGESVELFRIRMDGVADRLTRSPKGTLHYHPSSSADGKKLLYGSKRAGVRQLFAMILADRSERRLTDLERGHAAMWASWQPSVHRGNEDETSDR